MKQKYIHTRENIWKTAQATARATAEPASAEPPTLLCLPSLEKVVHVFHEDNLIRRALLQKLKHVTSCSSSPPQLLSFCEHFRVTDTPYFGILEIQRFREFMVVFGEMLGHHDVPFICTFTTLQSGTDLGRTLGSSNVVDYTLPIATATAFSIRAYTKTSWSTIHMQHELTKPDVARSYRIHCTHMIKLKGSSLIHVQVLMKGLPRLISTDNTRHTPHTASIR
ncbi:hypothetical protein PsorP6_012277 [Peronosclerospora sorghi]|uniref:Uncharacterized protein n=1 Tax=Peronosclerospora sorghi TaxID=230839 RepID=A0ACC0WJX1_9STRA|nr:hypothetical protein PsorP6_012277 [Peronosclerospora sorghi]